MSRPPPKFVDVDADFDKKSLKAMCIRKAMKIVNSMESIGDGSLTYLVARHFLHRVESANRLAIIEQNSPHIIGDDAEIWQKLIRRHFPDSERKNYEPEDEAAVDWHGVYLRYQEEKDAELETAKAILRQSYGAAMGQRAENVSHKVEAKFMPKPPRDPKLLANAGIPISRRNYGSNSYTRSKPVGFIGHAATGIKRQRNLVELARKEAAAQVAMRKQAKAFIPDTKSQIRKAPAALVQQHESEDRAKRLAPPPMPDADKPKRLDPVEARIARIKAAKTAREAKEKGVPPPQENTDNSDIADLFDDSLLTPSERRRESSPPRIQLPGGGMARKVATKTSPRFNPAVPHAPPKKVDIFFTGKKKPIPPPSAPKCVSSSSGAIPNPNLNGAKTGFTPARLPPRMASMAQGARGAIRPTGTVASRKAIEMKSMRPVNAVTDRQGAGRPSAVPPLRPAASNAVQRSSTVPASRLQQLQQQKSTGGGGVTSMLAGLVAKQDAERSSHTLQPRSVRRSSPSLKRGAPTESPAIPAKRMHTDPTRSRSSSSTNNPPPATAPPPSRDRAAAKESPLPIPVRKRQEEMQSQESETPSSSQNPFAG